MKHQVDFLELLQIDYEKYPVIAVVGGRRQNQPDLPPYR